MNSSTPPKVDVTGLADLRALLEQGKVIESVVHDSRLATPGSLYACLRGDHFDGHDFAADAVRSGAVALLVDHRLDELDAEGRTIAQIVVDDTRLRLGPIAAELAEHPSRSLATVGITGTNGKTTTAALMAAIFEAAGRPCGVVGTLSGPRTTPEAPELQAALAGFVADGRTAAVLEVSSHALAMHRVDGTAFDAVVFTNLGHDHLDLHGTHEAYFRAKAMLFDPSFASLGVVNLDDAYGRLLADAAASDEPGREFRIVGYSTTELSGVDVTAGAHRYVWRGHQVHVPLGGDFNVSNSLAALTAAVELGIDADVAIAGLGASAPVPGRFEVIDSVESARREIAVVVDYAHTPDGLERVIAAARSVVGPGGSVVVVFGCGGDRDRAKRPAMGRVAAAAADRVIVTSDNPRSEPPEQIIDEILSGVGPSSRGDIAVVVDRREAIRTAIEGASSGDVVVIAGKGHEATQEFADHTTDFDDRAVALEFLEAPA